VTYARDRDLSHPFKPLFYRAIRVIGKEKDRIQGRQVLWWLKPGRQVNRTNVTDQLALPFDTTVHYIGVHLHPFAESLQLKDLTTRQVLFTSRARNFSQGIGVASVDTFSSAEGIPVYRDHQYELTSVYHAPDAPAEPRQDAAASMFLFLFDKHFKKPDVVGPIAGDQEDEPLSRTRSY
jgi:hypothetical protein